MPDVRKPPGDLRTPCRVHGGACSRHATLVVVAFCVESDGFTAAVQPRSRLKPTSGRGRGGDNRRDETRGLPGGIQTRGGDAGTESSNRHLVDGRYRYLGRDPRERTQGFRGGDVVDRISGSDLLEPEVSKGLNRRRFLLNRIKGRVGTRGRADRDPIDAIWIPPSHLIGWTKTAGPFCRKPPPPSATIHSSGQERGCDAWDVGWRDVHAGPWRLGPWRRRRTTTSAPFLLAIRRIAPRSRRIWWADPSDRIASTRVASSSFPLPLPWIFAASMRIGRAPCIRTRAAHLHDRSIDRLAPLSVLAVTLPSSTVPTVDRPHRPLEKKLPRNPTVGEGRDSSLLWLVCFRV